MDILECEAALVPLGVEVEHCELVGVFIRYLVNYIKAEVEGVCVLEFYALEPAVLILMRLDEFLAQQLLRALGGDYRAAYRLLLYIVAGENDGAEVAVLAVNGYHSVRGGAVVIDAVALAEDLGVLAYLHLQLALEYQVEFLAAVLGQVDGGVLLLG